MVPTPVVMHNGAAVGAIIFCSLSWQGRRQVIILIVAFTFYF